MESKKINWYPGHMAKTKRLIEENLKHIDIIVEILDARIPVASKNPDIDLIIQEKPRLILLNKAQLADDVQTSLWQKYYEKKNVKCIKTDCLTGLNINKITPKISEILSELTAKRDKKGIVGAKIKIMVLGVPNVGKSSLINKLMGSKKVKVEDRPGVTRGKQWISLNNQFDILDMPGILAPKLATDLIGINLSITGAIRDQINDLEFLAAHLLETLNNDYKSNLEARYKVCENDIKGYELLKIIGKKRDLLISGGEVDTERAAIMILNEFRAGKLGRITLEKFRM